MSLRRKSCNACFKGRRKCDRGYPTCSTCQKTNKSCLYAYAPNIQVDLQHRSASSEMDIGADGTQQQQQQQQQQHLTSNTSQGMPIDAATEDPSMASFVPPTHNPMAASSSSSSSLSTYPPSTPPVVSHIPNFLGGLGELQRIEGYIESCQWAINQLKQCPHELATRGETLFLHKELYRDIMPASIRTALGTCASFCLLNEDNRGVLFRVVDAEVGELLGSAPLRVGVEGGRRARGGMVDLIEELGRVQALTLYQMIRLFGGGVEQRAVVDLQRGMLTTRALQLLRRSQAELQRVSDWHSWIIGESIRRTVMVIFVFYAMYSMAMHGFCVDFATITRLPVSTAPAFWHSEAEHMVERLSREAEGGRTLTYEAFTQTWAVSPNRTLYPFEKFLIIPCKGFEGVAAYTGGQQV